MRMTFAKRIKRARKKLNLSQKRAAAEWGFSQQVLSQWELGTDPKGLYREKIEAILRAVEDQPETLANASCGQ